MKSNRNYRNYGIDLIRSLSVLYIISYWHLFNYTDAFRGYYNPVTHNLTRIILASFVFISGYLIASKNFKINWTNISNFWRKRLVRIYPLYALALLLFYWQDIANMTTLVKAALLLSMFFPPAPPTLWFITMIMVFYLIAPFLLKYANDLTIYLVITSLLWVVFFFKGTWEISLFFPSFALGMWLRANTEILNKLQQKQFILTIFLGILFSLQITDNFTKELLFVQMLFINIGAILFYFYSYQIMKEVKSTVLIEQISYASFCMYLFHRPIFSLTKSLFFPSSETAQVIYLLGIAVPLTIIISWLVQKLYDRFVLPWLK